MVGGGVGFCSVLWSAFTSPRASHGPADSPGHARQRASSRVRRIIKSYWPHHDILIANVFAQAGSLAFGQSADEVRAATNRLRAGVVGDPVELPLAAIPEIMFTLCLYPDLWQKVMDLSLQLQATGKLAPRDRQA